MFHFNLYQISWTYCNTTIILDDLNHKLNPLITITNILLAHKTIIFCEITLNLTLSLSLLNIPHKTRARFFTTSAMPLARIFRS